MSRFQAPKAASELTARCCQPQKSRNALNRRMQLCMWCPTFVLLPKLLPTTTEKNTLVKSVSETPCLARSISAAGLRHQSPTKCVYSAQTGQKPGTDRSEAGHRQIRSRAQTGQKPGTDRSEAGRRQAIRYDLSVLLGSSAALGDAGGGRKLRLPVPLTRAPGTRQPTGRRQLGDVQ